MILAGERICQLFSNAATRSRTQHSVVFLSVYQVPCSLLVTETKVIRTKMQPPWCPLHIIHGCSVPGDGRTSDEGEGRPGSPARLGTTASCRSWPRAKRPTVHTKWNLIRAIGRRVPLSAPVSHVTRDAGAGDDKVWEPWRGTRKSPWGGMDSGRSWGRPVTRLGEQALDLSPLFPEVTTHCGTEGLCKRFL